MDLCFANVQVDASIFGPGFEPYQFSVQDFDPLSMSATAVAPIEERTSPRPVAAADTGRAPPQYPEFVKYRGRVPRMSEIHLDDGNPHPLLIAEDRQGTESHKSIARFEPGTIRSSLIYKLLIPMYGKDPTDGMHALKDPSWDPFSGNKYTRHGVLYEPLGLALLRGLVLRSARRYCERSSAAAAAAAAATAAWKPSDVRFTLDHYYAHWEPGMRHVYCSPDAEVEDRATRFRGLFECMGMSKEEAEEWACDRLTVELKHPYVRMYDPRAIKPDHSCQTQFQADCSRCEVALYMVVYIPPSERLSSRPMGPARAQVQLWACRRSPLFCSWMCHNLKRARRFALDPSSHHDDWRVDGSPPFDSIRSRKLCCKWIEIGDRVREEWRERAFSYRADSGELVSILRDHFGSVSPEDVDGARDWSDLVSRVVR